MPWTFAHPAAVLPLRQLGSVKLPLLGLVVGSIIPDLGYYLGRTDLATFAHTSLGLFVFCLPASFLLVLILLKLRQFLLAPLPQPHRSALSSLSSPAYWPSSAGLKMIIAILLGAATHLVWDAFTHANGAAVQALEPLHQHVLTVSGRTFRVFNILQHASTLIGVLILIHTYRCWLIAQTGNIPIPSPVAFRAYIPLLTAFILSCALGIGVAVLRADSGASFSALLVQSITEATKIFLVAYGLLAWRAHKHPQR